MVEDGRDQQGDPSRDARDSGRYRYVGCNSTGGAVLEGHLIFDMAEMKCFSAKKVRCNKDLSQVQHAQCAQRIGHETSQKGWFPGVKGIATEYRQRLSVPLGPYHPNRLMLLRPANIPKALRGYVLLLRRKDFYIVPCPMTYHEVAKQVNLPISHLSAEYLVEEWDPQKENQTLEKGTIVWTSPVRPFETNTLYSVDASMDHGSFLLVTARLIAAAGDPKATNSAIDDAFIHCVFLVISGRAKYSTHPRKIRKPSAWEVGAGLISLQNVSTRRKAALLMDLLPKGSPKPEITLANAITAFRAVEELARASIDGYSWDLTLPP